MSQSIVERVLGKNSLHTENYLDKTILLVKSISVVLHSEAKLYNELVEGKYGLKVNVEDKSSWRYYLHLTGSYHQVDEPILVTSWDNGEEITLSKTTINRHKTTRNELLKFGNLYKTLVDRYPEQELLIKSIINTSDRILVTDAIKLKSFKIVSLNKDLVEKREYSLILRLQERIDNYVITKAITYYTNAESLFLSSLYVVLYNFIYTTVINLRLANAKTPEAHSYHILSYFASHHSLDNNYPNLDENQILFLYRNMKYLNTYAGTNEVFQKLIDKFFTVRRVPVINYQYKQKNSIDQEGHVEYRFVQKLLNKENLIYDPRDFDLDEIANKEVTILDSNAKEYFIHRDDIDFKNKNSLHSDLLTKDLEISIVDNSADVKYGMTEMIIDYWAQTLNLGVNNHILNLSDPVKGRIINMDSEEAFKLLTVVIHYVNGQRVEVIPDYYINRVVKPTLPTTEELVSKNFRKSHYLKELIEDLVVATPRYYNIDTPSTFNEFVLNMYKYELGSWLHLVNLGDKDMNSQLYLASENLHYNTVYKQGDVSVTPFLKGISFTEVEEYTEEELYIVLNELLKVASLDLSSRLEKNKRVQSTLFEVLGKFKSYSTQLTNEYISSTSELGILGTPYSTLNISSSDDIYQLPSKSTNVDFGFGVVENSEIVVEEDVLASSGIEYNAYVDIGDNSEVSMGLSSDITINLPTPVVMFEGYEDWVKDSPSQEQLLFLSLNN